MRTGKTHTENTHGKHTRNLVECGTERNGDLIRFLHDAQVIKTLRKYVPNQFSAF